MKPSNTDTLSEITRIAKVAVDARADEIRAPYVKALTEERAQFAKQLKDLKECVLELMNAHEDAEKLKKGAFVPMPVRSAHLVPQGTVSDDRAAELRGLELARAATQDPAAQVALKQAIALRS